MNQGREFVVKPAYDEKIEDYLRPLFQQYYTMSFDNYPVEMERIETAGDHLPSPMTTKRTMITLTLKEQPDVPLEAEILSPDVMAG